MRSGRFCKHPPKPIGRSESPSPFTDCRGIPARLISYLDTLNKDLKPRRWVRILQEKPQNRTRSLAALPQKLELSTCAACVSIPCVRNAIMSLPNSQGTINTSMIITLPENMGMKVVGMSTSIRRALSSTYQLSLLCRASLGRDPVAEPGVTLGLCPPEALLCYCPSRGTDVTLLSRTSA